MIQIKPAAVHAADIPLATNPLKLFITQEGIVSVSAAYLTAHGVDLTNVPVATLGLSDNGTPTPISVTHAGSLFGQSGSDSITFYAHPINNTYATTNVYVLADRDRVGADEPRSRTAVPEQEGLDRHSRHRRRQRSASVESGVADDFPQKDRRGGCRYWAGALLVRLRSKWLEPAGCLQDHASRLRRAQPSCDQTCLGSRHSYDGPDTHI
ncbi:MAG: hypothetical protein M3Z66_22560 [Chloroflexota bacterium]|nr:hypothetical protein [Chloroflexota bacterium]